MGRRLRIFLYNESPAPSLHLDELADRLRALLPAARVESRPSLLSHHLTCLSPTAGEAEVERLARAWASARVRDPFKEPSQLAVSPSNLFEPLYGEVEYEKRRLVASGRQAIGVLYDGLKLVALHRELLPATERSRNHVHILVTGQLLGTWEEDDRRYHYRVNVCAVPSMVSTAGIVEAPARPREYYLLKQQYQALNMYDAAAVTLEREFAGRIMTLGDERMTAVALGCVLQCLSHQITGEAFCDDPSCRLFNAHWQEELLRAQLGGDYEFCSQHERWLKELAS